MCVLTQHPMGNTRWPTRNRRSRRGTYWSTGSRAHDHWPGRDENTTMKSSRSLKWTSSAERGSGSVRWQPHEAQRAARQQSGPTHAREHSCVWRFRSETTTIPLTPPVLCVTVWDRRNLALWRIGDRQRASAAFRYQALNELTVRRAHPVCLQLDRSPDPGRQGRALLHLRNVPIHVSDLF